MMNMSSLVNWSGGNWKISDWSEGDSLDIEQGDGQDLSFRYC